MTLSVLISLPLTCTFASLLICEQGDVDIVCGGPPCQGASGHNRFRNCKDPLNDERNRQLLVFMNCVEYLQPRYVLMENVSDLMKVKDGFLAKFGIASLVEMNYQVCPVPRFEFE